MPRTWLRLIALLTLSGLICCEPLAADATGHPIGALATETSPLLRQVSPQTTDPAIDAWLEPHLVGFDPTAAVQGRLFIFFSGSYGQPENQRLILEQAARAGYHAIGLRYPNSWTINELCAPSGDLLCFGAVRLEILSGEDRSPLVTITPANSIRNRLGQLLAYLARTHPEEGWGQFLDSSGVPRWALMSAGGHSQGGGQAAMLGKQEALARVCMLSAPADSLVQAGALAQAPWLAEPGQTPPEAYVGLASELEAGYARVLAAWAALGLVVAPSPVLVEEASSDYSGAQALSTRLEPARPGDYHGSTAVDRSTPLLADGTPVLAPAWHYLCFPQPAQSNRLSLPLLWR
jgi:hypothetical protein